MRVNEALPEPLHFNQPAPCCTRGDLVVALREGCGRRSIGRCCIGIMHVHIYQLSTKGATKSWCQVAHLHLEGDGRTIRTDNDTEILKVESSGVEGRVCRIGIVARAVIVTGGVCGLKDERTSSEIEDEGPLAVG